MGAAVVVRRLGQYAILADGGAEFLGGFLVLDGGIGPPGPRCRPRALPLQAPMLDDLAGGLAGQVKGNAIFAACVLGGVDHRYRPEAEYLIEQVEYPLPRRITPSAS